MRIFCATCRRTFPAEAENIVYDNGSNMAVFKCDVCGTKYLAVADDQRGPVPILLKLASTKSFVTDIEPEEKSQIIVPDAAPLIVTPQQAAEELRRKA